MGSLVPLLGRDCQARDKELPGQTRNFPLHLTGRLVTPTALGQGHCPPFEDTSLWAGGPMLLPGSQRLPSHCTLCPLLGSKGSSQGFQCQASSSMSPPPGICGVPVQSLEPPENSGYPANQGQCTFRRAQDIHPTRAIIMH